MLSKKRSLSLPADVKEPQGYRATAINMTILGAVCAYGGYFNGGLGIILLAALGIMGQRSLQGMNGLKCLLSVVLTIVSIVVYAAGDVIEWQYIVLLAVAAILGGYAGAALAYRTSQIVLKSVVVSVGLLMSVGFFWFNC